MCKATEAGNIDADEGSLLCCREQLSQLSVHVEMASNINRGLEADQLTAVGKLEQDVVFGEVTSKHILEFFTAYPDLSPEAKVCPCKGSHPISRQGRSQNPKS